jgi:hypothetical protein
VCRRLLVRWWDPARFRRRAMPGPTTGLVVHAAVRSGFTVADGPRFVCGTRLMIAGVSAGR